MSTKRTTADMSVMFDGFVDQLNDILKNGEVEMNKDGEAIRCTPKAATLSTIRQFLKDQNITATPANKGLSELAIKATALPFEVPSEDNDSRAVTSH